jgi:hypothetical protein
MDGPPVGEAGGSTGVMVDLPRLAHDITETGNMWRFLRVTWRIASRVIELAIVVFVLNADIG